jgi:hypothetical protein
VPRVAFIRWLQAPSFALDTLKTVSRLESEAAPLDQNHKPKPNKRIPFRALLRNQDNAIISLLTLG